MVASIGNSKAMIGVIFLQYCSYALFYILDEVYGWAPPHYTPLIQAHRDRQAGESQAAAAGPDGGSKNPASSNQNDE